MRAVAGTNEPLPIRGDTALDGVAALQVWVGIPESSPMVARVGVLRWHPDEVGATLLDSTISSTDPDYLDQLAQSLSRASMLLRAELGAAALREDVQP